MKLLLLLFFIGYSIGLFSQQKTFVFARTDNDSVFIHSDINNQNGKTIIDSIILSGNKVTKPRIIFRELTFRKSDTIRVIELSKKLSRSRENLLNTSLFNFVTIHDSIITTGEFSHIHIQIHFIERWYLWPLPIFEISDRNLNTWWETKDFNRISYGLLLVKENMRGRMEKLNLLLRFGYDETYQMSYDIPYINQKQTFGSGLGLGFAQNHEVAYKTINNKLILVKNEDKYIYKRFYSYFNITHRPSLYQHHLVQLNYNYYSFDDTLLKLNPDYSFNAQNTNEYLTLHYRFTYDNRDSKVYPLSGDRYEATLSKGGFGVFKDGDISTMELMGSYSKHWRVSKKFFLGTYWAGKFSTVRDQPYFYQQGLGYGKNFVRGYELYVIDGQSYVLSKNTVKFNLIPTNIKEIKFLKSEKFNKIHYTIYLNWFLDAGYVSNFKNAETNHLNNAMLLSTGFGLDIVTYYDLLIRLELSINKESEIGFFFHIANTL